MIRNLIYDVGMYDGADTEYYLHKGYNVVSVEADPILAERGKKRFKKFILKGKLKIINQGIAPEVGQADFFVNEVNPFWNSFDESISSRDQLPYHKISIECNKFDNILKENGVPYYLKIDIEGHDKYCLEALNRKDLPKYVSFEADNEGNLEMLEMVKDLGYKKFKCINQNTFLPIEETYCTHLDKSKLKPKEMLFLTLHTGQSLPLKVLRKLKVEDIAVSVLNPPPYLRFNKGTSGPFGEDLEGEWMTFEEIKVIYKKSYADYIKKSSNNYSFWCDFHATW